ncbi:MAG: helix-turn-helix domain-containing protein [Methyloprofundus sp.]|nr:helix-turn-helix domain-containing protein [Methyloprofundus sp.]
MKKNNSKKQYVTGGMPNALSLIAASIGVPFERIVRETGLSLSKLMDIESRVPDHTLLKMLQMFEGMFPNKATSLELARLLPLNVLGRNGHLFYQAQDLETSLNLLNCHYDLFVDRLEMELIDKYDVLALRFYHPLDKVDEGLGSEVLIGAKVRFARMYFGDKVIASIQFTHAPRYDLTLYDDYFQVPVRFNAPYNAVLFHRDHLNSPNIQGQMEKTEVLEKRIQLLRQEFYDDNLEADYLNRIRFAIAKNSKRGDYTAQGLATTLAMSLRNLQRSLRHSNTSARLLIDEYRYANTLELLTKTQLSIAEISLNQGFDSERGFRKAFKRWAKNTPGAVRKTLS